MFLVEKTANKPTESNVNYIESNASSESDTNFEASYICSTPAVKKRKIDKTDALLSTSLTKCNELIKSTLAEDEDEESFYCRSFIPMLKELPKKENRASKIKISQLSFDLQYNKEN